MNLAALLATGCSLGLFHVQQSGMVAYETEGKPLQAILKDLTSLGDTPLKASPQFASDVFAIHVRDKSLDELKAQIAQVEHAQWVQETGYQLLSQTSKESKSETSFHEQYVLEALDASLHAQEKQLELQPAFDENGAAQFARRVDTTLRLGSDPSNYTLALQALEPLSPSHRAIVRTLTSLGAHVLAALPLRIKVYYSNVPTSGERQLPDASMDAVSKFLEEQDLWAREAGPRAFPSVIRNGVSQALPGFLADRSVIAGPWTKVLLSLYRESELGRIYVDLKLANAAGQVVGRASANVTPVRPATPSAAFVASERSHPVVVQARAAELTAMGLGKPLSTETREALLHPERIDPLAITYGSTLMQVAEEANLNLVAILTDQLLDGGLRQPRYNTVEDYLKVLAGKGQRSEADSTWLTVSPADLLAGRRDRADRSSLGTYLRGAVTKSLSVEQEATFALALPDPLQNMLPATVLGRLENRMVALRDVSLLRFYGTLSAENRQQAQMSDGLRLTDLAAPESIQYLNEIVFARTNPLITPRNARPEISREPSECLANGLGGSSVLHLTVTEKDAVFDLNKDKAPYQLDEGSVSAGEVAFSEYRRRHPEKFPPQHGGPTAASSAHFVLGELKTYLFDFRFAPDVWTDSSLEGRSIEAGDPLVFDQLPESFLAEVAKMYSFTERAGVEPPKVLGGAGSP
jgi:hypothetical protein